MGLLVLIGTPAGPDSELSGKPMVSRAAKDSVFSSLFVSDGGATPRVSDGSSEPDRSSESRPSVRPSVRPSLSRHAISSSPDLSQNVYEVRSFNTSPLEFPVDALKHPFVRFGNTLPMQLARTKVDRGQGLKISVFGGSVTAGRSCAVDRRGLRVYKAERPCAWPAQLRIWLQRQFPHSNNSFEVYNFGSGGCTTASALPVAAMRVRSLQPDLVIWDYSLNDCSGFASARLRALASQHPDSKAPPSPELVREVRKKDERDSDGFRKSRSHQGKTVALAGELFVRLVLELVPKAMLVMVFAGPPRAWSGELGWAIADCQEAFLPVAAHYGVSVVSYFDLVDQHEASYLERGGVRMAKEPGKLWSLPEGVRVPWMYKGKWQDHRHPTRYTHLYIAYVLAAFLQASGSIGVDENDLADLSLPGKPVPLPHPLAKQSELDRWPVCTQPLTSYIAQEVFRTGNASGINGKEWNLMEDVPGKPGWISTELHTTISFSVTFGQHPALAVTYLSSYEGLGEVMVRLGQSRHKYKVSGTWADRTSQANTIFFRPADKFRFGIDLTAPAEALGGDGLGGFEVRAERTYDLSLTLMPNSKRADWNKFKILAVFSC